MHAQALLVSDFGPKISFRIVDTLREEIRDGKLKSGAEIKVNSIGLGCCFSVSLNNFVYLAV